VKAIALPQCFVSYYLRLREGYTVNSVNIEENIMKVKLTLPWKYHTFIHYTVFSFWPPSSRPEWSRCRVEVI
jgi:hypothetical protein